MISLQSTHPSAAVYFSGRHIFSSPFLLFNMIAEHSFGIVSVLLSCLAKLMRRHRVMFPLVHVESKKPYGFRPFPLRFTARVQDFLGVNSSIVSERSALRNSDCRRQSNPHSSRPFRIISFAVRTTTIVVIVVSCG
jgi:hypothetical protein